MSAPDIRADLSHLAVFIGDWRMTASLAGDAATSPPAHTSFEWLEGRRFLIQRWHVAHPEAPDGIAIIGFDEDQGTYLQHYFDSRGVARVYEMTFANQVWKLLRIAPGFSQRFTGTFNEPGDVISGRWERSHDGSSWEHDFDLTYTRDAQ